MFPVEAFQRTVEHFVSILQRLEIPFHITGGSISSAYGEPRLTQDIDIVVSPEIAKKRLDELVEAISKSDFLYEVAAISVVFFAIAAMLNKHPCVMLVSRVAWKNCCKSCSTTPTRSASSYHSWVAGTMVLQR